ncbi:LapA family protein [uncultured Pseudacidovorax sp.]|uniref:LapA family protein n=1 Tax=uncultured Pseudacidovorax sp. TaxID=679313 RepID=UPI0025FF6D66|nr:LapA family protein [uncultured Pseudacidovorax sp.]
MGARSIILFVIALLIAALAALNWGTLSAPTAMSLGVTTVTAPLGLVMLGLTILLAAFFLAYVLWLQGTVLLDARRHTKELQAQRELADRAEASRFTELRTFLESQESTLAARTGERHAAILARIEQLETALRQRADQADNTLAAHIGQLEDRLDRRPAAVPAATPVGVTPLTASTVPASFDPRG